MSDTVKEKAEAIIRGMDRHAARDFITRVEHHPDLLALYERAIFEQFVPNDGKLAPRIDIKSAALGAANHILARLEGNELIRATKEADALELIVHAMPVAKATTITSAEINDMNDIVSAGITNLASRGQQECQEIKPEIDGFLESDAGTASLRDLALARRIIEAAEEILGDNIHRFIVQTYEEEHRGIVSNDSATLPASKIAEPPQQLGRITNSDRGLLH